MATVIANHNATRKSIRIAVATHKPYRMPDDSCYFPLHVGAALHPEICVGMQQDNEGDNISSENAFYSELTGMYWLWKNCDSDYKGLVHYRRHFRTSNSDRAKSKDPFGRIASGADFRNLIASSGAQVVVPTARNYFIETIESHYRHTLPGEQLDATRSVLGSLAPKFLPAFDREMTGIKAHMFNMLVAERSVFDGYCAWLFPLLADIEQVLDSSDYDAFNARWPGRISELLLDVWMNTNGIRWAEMPTMSPEPVDWISKGKGFLAAKFLGRKYKRSF